MLTGFIYVLTGAFFIWLGAFQIITAMLPHDFAMQAAEKHGAWVREHIFKLPPENQTQSKGDE